MAKRFIVDTMAEAFYNQVDPRRRQEIHDSRMIREDHTAMSNLSGVVINKQYNQNRFKHNSNSAPNPEFIFFDEVGE